MVKAIRWAVDIHEVDIISMSLGWETEHRFEGKYVVRDAISYARTARGQNVLFFAAASNYGGGRHELFPARDSQTFSIRATDHHGKHSSFNASLPTEAGINVYGSLGEGVPVSQTGGTHTIIGRTGTSPATAIVAGIAALVVGYTKASSVKHTWQQLRTMDGFASLLCNLATEPEARKRFITLENVYNDLETFESCLDGVSATSRTH